MGGANNCIVEISVWNPNPLGWQSYKIVVKQQEQEYYNTYLPGFTSGYPVRTPVKERGRTAFAIIIADNINKLPRDLQEVGPLQSEFSSSVRLYGRVNNPTIDNRNVPPVYASNITYLWNSQYFPTRTFDEIVTIGPVGSGGLELANSPFTAGNLVSGAFLNPTDAVGTDGVLPWGLPGGAQSFYNVEENPLVGNFRVGAQKGQPQLVAFDNILNTLGAKVVLNPLTTSFPEPYAALAAGTYCMEPFLSVSETEPVESNLDIFYESSTSKDFVNLYKQL